jgi:hypothetical protein
VAVLHQLLDWLADGGDVAVFDATNTTAERRARVLRVCKKRSPLLNVVFVESVCDDAAVLEENYKQKATHSPDYKVRILILHTLHSLLSYAIAQYIISYMTYIIFLPMYRTLLHRHRHRDIYVCVYRICLYLMP